MRLSVSVVLMSSMLVLAGCNASDTLEVVKVANKVEQPLPDKILNKMKAQGIDKNAPIMMRIFKEEGVLEVWKANRQNRYQLVADYNICAWSGRLGPKKKEGDRQAPEGYYNIYPSQMNPQSEFYLSFNMGFPNKYDRVHGFRGSNLMVHGACSSAGCYSMTDAQILQIYSFARDAFRGGQEAFQVQALPFRMTPENMARHRFNPNFEFWKQIKVGYDYFELTKRPPVVEVCEKKYVFNQIAPEGTTFQPGGACPATATPPALASAYSSYAKTFQKSFDVATNRWDSNDYIEPSEDERKALAATNKRNGAKAKTRYVVIDPKAKVTPTSDAIAVAGLKPDQKIALGTMMTNKGAVIIKPVVTSIHDDGTDQTVTAGTTANLSAARLAANRQNANSQTVAGQTVAGQNVAGQTAANAGAEPTVNGAKVPVPVANPLKPAVTTAQDQTAAKKPFWKIW